MNTAARCYYPTMRSRVALTCRTAAMASLWVTLCGCREPTQIKIEIHTDVPCDEYDDTSIAVGLSSAIETMLPAARTSACSDDGTVGSLVAVPSGRDEPLAIKVAAATGGFDVALCVPPDYHDGCIVSRRALRYVDHTSLLLPIHMRAACINEFCEPGQTCIRGTCQDATIEDPGLCAGGDGCPEGVLYPSGGTGPPVTVVLTSPGDATRPRIVHTGDGWALVWRTDTEPYYALLSNALGSETVPPTAANPTMLNDGGPELVFTDGRVVVATWHQGTPGHLAGFPPEAPWDETPSATTSTVGGEALAALSSSVVLAMKRSDTQYDIIWYDDHTLIGNGTYPFTVQGTDPALAAVDDDWAMLATWQDGTLHVESFYGREDGQPGEYVDLGPNVRQRTPALAVAQAYSTTPTFGVAWADLSGTLHLAHGEPTFGEPTSEVPLGQGGGMFGTEPSLAWGDGAFYLAWTRTLGDGGGLALARITGEPLQVTATITVTDQPGASEPAVAVDQDGAHLAVAWVATATGNRQVHVTRYATDLSTP